MIEEMQGSAGSVIGLRATGIVTDEDYKNVLIPRLEDIIAEYGKARILFDFADDFHGYELAALWDDATFGLKHSKDFERCAMVGGPKWIDWASKLAGFFIKSEVKTFPSEKLQDAWGWVKS